MDGEKEIKSFISSIKKAIMSTSVETLKEDQLEGVLNSFRDANNVKGDISEYFEIPTSIQVFQGHTDSFRCSVDENFAESLETFIWSVSTKDSSKADARAGEDIENVLDFNFSVKGVAIGSTTLVITFTYIKNNSATEEEIEFTIPVIIFR